MALVCAFVLSACGSAGGGGGSGSSGGRNFQPSFSYASNVVYYPVGSAITADTLNVSNAATSYSISPALPAGLTFNSSNGTISGTPSAASAAQTYTVTGNNSAGENYTTLVLGTGSVAAISYGGPYSWEEGNSVSVSPTISGGYVTGCAVSPALPAGLSVDSQCDIIGSPTVGPSTGSYTITPSYGAPTSVAGTGVSVSIQITTLAPNLTYPSGGALTFIEGVSVGTVSPTVSNGPVTSCSISGGSPLPPGLSFDSTNCDITGTPTSIQAATAYTVTASNTHGTSTNSITIAVQNDVPAIGYSPTTYTYSYGTAITTLTPTSNTGGPITSCAISAASGTLAANTGLSFSTTTCAISGTPSVLSGPVVYTITPSNSAGAGSGFAVTISVTDVAPKISFSGSPYTFTDNQAITAVSATRTAGSTVTGCAVTGNTLPSGVSINPVGGTCQISGTPETVISATSYTVTPSNSAGSGTPVTISIAVVEQKPNISFSGSPFNFTLNSTVGTISSTNTGGGNFTTNCSASPALPGGLSLSYSGTPNVCKITGTPNTSQAATNYNITASNSAGSATTTISIAVSTGGAPNIAYSPNSVTWNAGSTSVALGISPAGTGMTNTGGVISSCSISPAPPSGISFSTSTCELTGTPTAGIGQTSTNYTVTATNSSGSSSAVISIAITTAPVISYPSSPYAFSVGTPVTAFTPANTGGTITNCSISPNLTSNTGLTFSTTTCQISGAPTTAASAATYTVTSCNSDNGAPTCTGSPATSVTTLSITVNAAAPNIAYSPNSYTFNNGTAITAFTPSNTGGAITSCAISPNLTTITGLSFSTTTCKISGTPTTYAAAQTYAVTATNATGSSSANVTITVNDKLPVISYPGTPYSWTINTSIGTITPTTTGGGTITSCSVSPVLPAGLSISATCVITGTPTVMQPATNYTVTATDSGGSTNTNISIAIIAPPALSWSNPYVFGLNTPITTVNPSNTGSTPTNCSSSPSLSAATGLTLNSDCSISGTPTTAVAAANYTITACNSANSPCPGSGTTSTVNIAVVAPPVISYSPTSEVYTLRTTISAVTVTNTGGAISSCSSSPALPGGLTLSSTCGITGAPTSTSSSTSYTITATNTAGSSSATLTIRVKDQPEILFYGFMNTSGVWNASAENSENIWQITQDGQTVMALTGNNGAIADEYDSIFPSFPASGGGKAVFSSLTATNGTWNGTAASSFNIWTAAQGGGALTNLGATTNSSSSTLQSAPVYSPDNSLIAYTAMQTTGGVSSNSFNLWIMKADGTSQMPLTKNTTTAGIDILNPVFDPSSTSTSGTIYFQSKMATNAAGTPGTWNGAPAKSYNIWSVTYNSSGEVSLTRITNETAGFIERDCIEPAVTPVAVGGNYYLVYAAESRVGLTTPSSFNILYIDLSTATFPTTGAFLTSNTNASIDSLRPQFSADGNTIVFQSLMGTASTMTSGNGSTTTTWNGSASGSNNIWSITSWASAPTYTYLTNNTSSGLDSITPSFAPDDSKIIFGSKMNVGGSASACYNIWVMNVDGTSQSNVTANTGAGLDSYLAPNSNVMYIAQ